MINRIIDEADFTAETKKMYKILKQRNIKMEFVDYNNRIKLNKVPEYEVSKLKEIFNDILNISKQRSKI